MATSTCLSWGAGQSEDKVFKKISAGAGGWTDVYLSAVTYITSSHILLLRPGHIVIPGYKGGRELQSLDGNHFLLQCYIVGNDGPRDCESLENFLT